MPAPPFTPAEANSALEAVRPVAERLVALRQRLRELEHLQSSQLGSVAGNGAGTAGRDLAETRSELESLARAAGACLDRLDELGVLVKDPDTGLLDFPALRHGEPVELCWHVGEPAVEWWHRRGEGFAGRKPVDWDE